MTLDRAARATKFPPSTLHAAQQAERETGCPTCVSLAQWALESNFGKSLAGNNPFGIKWYEGSPYSFTLLRTQEYIRGKFVSIRARFQAFPSIDIAFIEHGKLVMNPKGPYRQAVPYAKDWFAFCHIMGPVYATDPNYAKKLVKLINDWALFEYNLHAND